MATDRDPVRRTHSVRLVPEWDGARDKWQCRGCGETWPPDIRSSEIERWGCGIMPVPSPEETNDGD